MYAKTKHVVDAAQLLRDMQLKGLVPAPETYGEMILALSRVGNVDQALTVLTDIKRRGLPFPKERYLRPLRMELNVGAEESRDLGYALRKELWHRGIVSEAGRKVLERLRKEGVPYVTATHDRNNPRSGGVMRNLGMKYCYSYEEQWQPKDIPVVFRMYQLNLDGKERVFRKYWDASKVHFIETGLT